MKSTHQSKSEVKTPEKKDNEANVTTMSQKKMERERASPQVNVFNKYDKVLDEYDQ